MKYLKEASSVTVRDRLPADSLVYSTDWDSVTYGNKGGVFLLGARKFDRCLLQLKDGHLGLTVGDLCVLPCDIELSTILVVDVYSTGQVIDVMSRPGMIGHAARLAQCEGKKES